MIKEWKFQKSFGFRLFLFWCLQFVWHRVKVSDLKRKILWLKFHLVKLNRQFVCVEQGIESSVESMDSKELFLSEKAFLNELLKVDDEILNSYLQRFDQKKQELKRTVPDVKRNWNHKRPGWELAYGKRKRSATADSSMWEIKAQLIAHMEFFRTELLLWTALLFVLFRRKKTKNTSSLYRLNLLNNLSIWQYNITYYFGPI